MMNNITMGISLSTAMRKTLMIYLLLTPTSILVSFCLGPRVSPNANLTSRLINGEMNALILDYLTVGGYSRAAASFAAEANLPPHQDSSSVELRQKIQNAIHDGRIHEAIQALNEVDPEVRCFHLVTSRVWKSLLSNDYHKLNMHHSEAPELC